MAVTSKAFVIRKQTVNILEVRRRTALLNKETLVRASYIGHQKVLLINFSK
jgi:dUTPase